LYNLSARGIFKLLANASFEEKANKWKLFPSKQYRTLIYNFFDAVCCADADDVNHFRSLLSNNVQIYMYGDTKYERAGEAKEIARTKSLLNSEILDEKNVFVVGSSWESDNDILLPVLDRLNSRQNGIPKPLLTLLAPHEPTEGNIEEIERLIKEHYPNLKPIRYSKLKSFIDENLILVDCVGILVSLYKYADIAYVGGGLQAGLHNVLEPAVFGIPVLFADDKISEEGEMLLQAGGGLAVNNAKVLYRTLTNLLKENKKRTELGRKSFSVFEKKNNTSSQIARLTNKQLK
jgi:3-deoxy-D-manno-octulosonic-acid transferase